MKQKNLNKANGFTLIELLVVITIIAILSIIALVIFAGVTSNARDARRKSDVDAIVNVIETNKAPGATTYVALADNQFSAGKIPSDTNRAYCMTTVIGGAVLPIDLTTVNWVTPATCPTLTGVNPPIWAVVSSSSIVSGTTTGFKVCANLENSTIYCKPSSQ